MKIKLFCVFIAFAGTTPSMAINPYKAFFAAFASFSVVQAGIKIDQCDASCAWSDDYDAFGDYLDGLTNCEKARLFPSMLDRHEHVAKTAEAFAKHRPSNKEQTIVKMKRIYDAYVLELSVLSKELAKTQELLFDECTSEESREILAKHVSMLTHGMEVHSGNLETLKGYLEGAGVI